MVRNCAIGWNTFQIIFEWEEFHKFCNIIMCGKARSSYKQNNLDIFNCDHPPPSLDDDVYVFNCNKYFTQSINGGMCLYICVFLYLSLHKCVFVYCMIVCSAGTGPRWLMVVETKSWDNAHGNDLWSGSSGALSVAYVSLWSGSTFVKYKYKYR